VRAALAPQDLAGRSLLITAGPTHEPIDPVRFVGNRSSGKMGVAIAAEALARGADVTLVLGPGTVPPPPGAEVVRIETAEELREAVLAGIEGADAVVMAAAVADFRPKEAAPAKLKKDAGIPDLLLEPTPDVLAELGERRPGPVLVGFAAETGDVETLGREKLAAKRVDLLVANRVGSEGTGFGADTNEAAILAADGGDVPLASWTKPELARALLDRVASLLDGA
jgi:phosphopantothenoylcysteine decarboxylase/phosphopantothenate--cysteine ligase